MATAKKRVSETRTSDRIVVHPHDLHGLMTSRSFMSAHSYKATESGEVGRVGNTKVFVSPEAPRKNWINVPMPVEVRTVIDLELTEGDADFLLAVLSVVGGSPKNSPRKYGERILKALKAATGTTVATETDAYKLVKDNGQGSRGAIYFKDYPDPDGGRKIGVEAAPAEPVKTLPFEFKFDLGKDNPFRIEPINWYNLHSHVADFPPPAWDVWRGR